MPRPRSAQRSASPRTRGPRRLSADARREQLVAAAMPIVADQGLADFSLEDVAAGADVTRNLLYHYFPRGREDIVLAVAERAGRELTDDWVVGDALPLEQRLEANFARIFEHAMAPTDAWRVHRRARAELEPELAAIVARFSDVLVSSVALNHLGTRNPPPLVRLAIVSYLAFAETALDEARATGAPRDRVLRILADTLVATIGAAVAAGGSGDALAGGFGDAPAGGSA
jgi:AcrR family transcriptional regulator